MKVGIMGGTFDPIHNGHIVLAKSAYQQFELDKVLVMPSANPPHKIDQVIATAKQRSEMVELAISDLPFLEYSGIEIERDGYIYTVETLAILKEANPETEYYFIVGADSLFAIEQWYKPDELFALTNILAANRDTKLNEDVIKQIQYLNTKYGANIFLLDMPSIHISSSDIRKKAAVYEDVSDMLPAAVNNYMIKAGIYDS